jgi:hypothetical protein
MKNSTRKGSFKLRKNKYKNRQWFVSTDEDDGLTKDLVSTILNFNSETDFLERANVYEKIEGVEMKLKKDLARLPSVDGECDAIAILKANHKTKNLKFRIYIQDSKDHKIVRWADDRKPVKKTYQKVSAEKVSGHVTKQPGTLQQ